MNKMPLTSAITCAIIRLTTAKVPIDTWRLVPNIIYTNTGKNDTYNPVIGGKDASKAYASPEMYWNFERLMRHSSRVQMIDALLNAQTI